LDYINGRVNDMPSVRSAAGVTPPPPSRFCPDRLQFANALPFFKAVSILFLLALPGISAQASAEIRAGTAGGEYRMTDRDTKEDAVRPETEEAKRNALDQVGAYLEAVTFLTSHIVLAENLHPDQATVRRQAEESLQRLERETKKAADSPVAPLHESRATPTSDEAIPSMKPPSREELLTGHGQGDLQKGRLVCQRVSELAARTDLAKQIRVLVKEHATDRVRERTGREAEQDIEVVREEIVQEYLQGVKIVDRRVDEEQKICTATAVMLKSQIQANPTQEPHDISSKP
jgi:hypothetical protein